jgi:hypothetical protein
VPVGHDCGLIGDNDVGITRKPSDFLARINEKETYL